MKQALVVIGNNFEETEAVTVIDILRRASIKVLTVSIHERLVKGSHDISLYTDAIIDDVNESDFSLVVCTGGPGTPAVRQNNRVLEIIKKIYNAGGYAAALCAAPTILAAAGILDGKRATFFPGNENLMGGAILSDLPVEVDGRIITGQAVGASISFGIKLIGVVLGKEKADGLIRSMHVHWMR